MVFRFDEQLLGQKLLCDDFGFSITRYDLRSNIWQRLLDFVVSFEFVSQATF